jgi:chemotaxis-related protein WspB
MLFLVLHIDRTRYALNTGQITEILPVVELNPIPHAPPGVAGAANYRGAPLPVVDLVQVMTGRSSRSSLNTRLIVVTYTDSHARRHRLGVIAEGATDMVRMNPMDFGPYGNATEATAYLGPVAVDNRGMIQWIDPSKLLPPTMTGTRLQEAAVR